MMEDGVSIRPRPWVWLVWLMLFAGLPAAVAGWEARERAAGSGSLADSTATRTRRPTTPLPPVEPVAVYALDADRARAINAAIPFSRLANPAARPFVFTGSETDLARAVDCLAAAQIFEAGDDAVGQQAVAQVVLNRVRHPAFPGTVCGVVFQGQERATGCQFTFSCDGALARTPSPAVWERARDIARAALAGKVFGPVGYATHYHTDWVVPYWSGSLDKLARVGTHLFFRWRGWWGTPPAFRARGTNGGEPLMARIARFSVAHQDVANALLAGPPALAMTGAVADLAARQQQVIGAESLGKTMAGVRLVAIAPGARTFLVELGRANAPDGWPAMAQTFCAGRTECRIMAWRAGNAPTGFPLNAPQIEAMIFAYIHNAASGLQRALWNCGQTPRVNKTECMRGRVPIAVPTLIPKSDTGLNETGLDGSGLGTGLDGVRRKQRYETVRIGPVSGTSSSNARQP